MNPEFHFKIGDLVSFKRADRVTEDFIDTKGLTGIVIEQRFVFTADNKFKVQCPQGTYWVSRCNLTLISSVKK